MVTGTRVQTGAAWGHKSNMFCTFCKILQFDEELCSCMTHLPPLVDERILGVAAQRPGQQRHQIPAVQPNRKSILSGPEVSTITFVTVSVSSASLLSGPASSTARSLQ